jgi:hypothetical protein
MTAKKSTETSELQVIIPESLSPVLKDTKIELSKAEAHAVAFAPSMQSYIELAENLKGLDKINPTETDAKIARENRLKMVKVRTAAEEIKDLRKEGIKAEGDLIQALYNVVKNSCLVTETEFTEIEKHQERVEAQMQAELAAARIELLATFGTDTTYLPLGVMTDEQFTRLLETETIAFNARKLAAEQAEAQRVEAELLAEEARKEQERLQAERIEAERLEAIRVKEENDKLQAQLDAERKEAQVVADRLAKENSEKLAEQQRLAKIEADKQSKLLAEQKEQADRLAKELQAKKDADAGIEADKKAAEQIAKNADDKEKVRQLHASLKALIIPEFTTKEGKEIGNTMREALEILIKGLVSDSKKLL